MVRNILFLAVSFLVSISANARKPQNVLWNLETLSMLRDATDAQSKASVRKMCSKADALLTAHAISVVDKESTRTGDKHYYESIAVYYWPDPSDPAKPYIVRDGEANPEYEKCDARRLSNFRNNLRSLVEAYYVSGQSKYAERAVVLLDTWFLNSETYMYPNFHFGQTAQGHRNGEGYPGAVSEAYYLCDVIEAIVLLDNQQALPRSMKKSLKKWFKELNVWLVESKLGQEMSNQTDNLGIVYDVLLYRVCSYVGNKKQCKALAKRFASERLLKHIDKDGSQPLELKRTKAMMYSIYNLQHIADFCMMAENDGYHLYRENSTLIDSALGFVNKYIDKQSSFPYKEIGDWSSYQRQFTNVQNQYRVLRDRK